MDPFPTTTTITTAFIASISSAAPTRTTTSRPFSLTVAAPSPTTDYTDPSDPPQRPNQSNTALTVVTIICCIGLLGFGIGYLRLRQMRRVARAYVDSLNPSPSHRSSERRRDCSASGPNMGSLQDDQILPLYTRPSSIPSLQTPTPAHLSDSHTKDTPPPYEPRP